MKTLIASLLLVACFSNYASANGRSMEMATGEEFTAGDNSAYDDGKTDAEKIENMKEISLSRAQFNCKSRKAKRIGAWKLETEDQSTPAGKRCDRDYSGYFCYEVKAVKAHLLIINAQFKCL